MYGLEHKIPPPESAPSQHLSVFAPEPAGGRRYPRITAASQLSRRPIFDQFTIHPWETDVGLQTGQPPRKNINHQDPVFDRLSRLLRHPDFVNSHLVKMMWDLSGGSGSGRRSPYPPMHSPGFPAPQPYGQAAYPHSTTPNIGSSYPPAPSYGSSQNPPYNSHSNSFDQYHTSTSKAIQFPSTSHYSVPPGSHVVIHHSKHRSSSHQRQRRHSHSGNALQAPAPVGNVPQVPIYPSSSYLKPAITYPPALRPMASSSKIRPSSNQQNHVSFEKPANKLTKPSHSSQPTSGSNPRRKALCIGINYRGQSNALRGCVNDAKRVREFLIKQGGYSPDNIVLLTDDVSDPRQLPTRKNIISGMKWLVRGAESNDALFFHYSGHGGQTRDLDGDEIDGFDEVIFPLDFKKNGHITDDEMHELMVKPLPHHCKLTALFDACHSGTVLDLPYIYSSNGRLKGSQIKDKRRIDKYTKGDVISWSGCKDGQTSADTFHGNVAVGAMSHAFVTSLSKSVYSSQLFHLMICQQRPNPNKATKSSYALLG
ncbi:hypothetical protein FA15DRAFT_705189 [Coprinopsis marcescibilis]|uniref:Peptidase C14 caspase domain-containing protein n=1 Tax=Coprinopsis marcescibilis TaxID=230819 RepID=A0A5C3KTV9_COPMA|nr:hypothetical protein FA15DRAFT_705189 [Coprinopsis marcescibilis]